MPKLRRETAAAALLFASLAAAGTAALAQETSNTVGPPQLKDFQLPGQRTTPPVTTPTPAPPPPPAQPAERRTEPEPTTERRAEPRAATAAPPRAAAADPLPPPLAEAETSLPPVEALPEQNAATPAPAPVLPDAGMPPPLVADPEEKPWLWPAVAAGAGILLLGLALLAVLRRRRRRAETRIEEVRGAAREELGDVLFTGATAAPPQATPKPEPEVAAAAATAAEERRPWLEIDIKPERAAATATDTSVHYALIIRNRGRDTARNIRIDAKLFNASADKEVSAFFQGPIHEQSGSPQVTIAPEGNLTLMGQVAMPKEEAREIEMNGLRIFVPMIAINVAYDWMGGNGRTSRSWIVGRESQATEKMGPFRLDLGPRIYRSVGRREAKLAMV